MLGKFSRTKPQKHSQFEILRLYSSPPAVDGKLSCISCNAIEKIVDVEAHDGHTLLRDSDVRVVLLEKLFDVLGVRLDALLRSNFHASKKLESFVMCQLWNKSRQGNTQIFCSLQSVLLLQ